MCDRGVLSKSNYVDARIFSQAPNEAPRELPEGFQPGPRDVICSRGADCFNNPGNKFFRSKLGGHLEEYLQAPNKMKKGIIVSSIIDEIREQGGAFVRQDTSSGRWFEVGDRLAREKTGQALRSALRKSSPTSLPAAKSAIRKCDSPMSSKSTGSRSSSRAALAPNPNAFSEELGASDRSLRTTSSLNSSPIPTTLAALTSSGPRRGGGNSSLVKLHSSRTWSGGDTQHEKALTSVPTTVLRRSLTDPSQLDPDDMSFVLPPTFLEDRESSVFGLPLPPLPPPPPPTADLQRQVSTWSSVIARLPGLLDYDPYPASPGALAAPASAPIQAPAMLRRESSGFFGARSNATAPEPMAVPREIRLDHSPDRRWAGPTHASGLDDEDNDDDIDLGDWDL